MTLIFIGFLGSSSSDIGLWSDIPVCLWLLFEVLKMAAANLVRNAFSGLLRKSASYRTPVVCRLSTAALQQKFQTANALIKAHSANQLQNEVRLLINQYNVIFRSVLQYNNIPQLFLSIFYKYCNATFAIVAKQFICYYNLKVLHNKYIMYNTYKPV